MLLASRELVCTSPNLLNPEPARQAPQLLHVCRPAQQQPARPEQIFRLERASDGTYELQATAPSTIPAPQPDGPFLFVILPDAPDCVICGIPPNARQALEEPRRGISGHTSLTHRQPVLYAGTFILRAGQLVTWNNDSGHYQPPAERRATNMFGAVQTVLPDALFQNVDDLSFQEQRALLTERGYAHMEDQCESAANQHVSPPLILAEDLAALTLQARNYESMD